MNTDLFEILKELIYLNPQSWLIIFNSNML